MYCKDCKFWSTQDGSGKKGCDAIGDNLSDTEHGALDDSGIWSEFVTGPNFGCIKFQPKP